MLVLTDNAAAAIRTVLGGAQLPHSSGVRIATTSDPAGLVVTAKAAAEEGDLVLDEDDGVRVFLEPTAAALLSDKVLDARVGDDGQVVEFLLAPQ